MCGPRTTTRLWPCLDDFEANERHVRALLRRLEHARRPLVPVSERPKHHEAAAHLPVRALPWFVNHGRHLDYGSMRYKRNITWYDDWIDKHCVLNLNAIFGYRHSNLNSMNTLTFYISLSEVLILARLD